MGIFSKRKRMSFADGKKYCIREFQMWATDFGVQHLVTIDFSKENPNTIEIRYNCEKNHSGFQRWLVNTVFSKSGCNLLTTMDVERIVFIDLRKAERESYTVAELREKVKY